MLRLVAYPASPQAPRDRALYVYQGKRNACLEFIALTTYRESDLHIDASHTLTLTRSRRNSRAYINYTIRCRGSIICYIDKMSQYLVRHIFIMRNKIVLTFLTFRRRLHLRGSGSYRELSISTVFYGFVSLVSVYGHKQKIYGRIYGFFLTRLGYLGGGGPIALSRSRYSTKKNRFFGRIYGFFRTEFGY